ncbi:MAG: prolyl oligopeptidase family serine peptidase, partial [Vicinamibacteraceae bacterium]|nr:prolyl oligopeptidase family serine peptidase [Vicinamibacteraceae bacterium]
MRLLACALALGCLLAQPAAAQDTAPRAAEAPRYLTPPAPIVDILDAPPPPTVTPSPARDVVALTDRKAMPSIAELAQPMLRLGGYRVNPRNNGPHRGADGIGLRFKRTADGREVVAALPAGTTFEPLGFSPTGAHFAVASAGATRVGLWLVDPSSGRATEVPGLSLAAAAGPSCEWTADGARLYCLALPPDRGAPPEPPAAPSGPNVQESSGRSAPVRTYQDLLTNPHDEALFEHYFTSRIAAVDAASAGVTLVGPPGLYMRAEPSPDGTLILVERLERPFSWLLPAQAFPRVVAVLDPKGALVHTLATRPLADAVPINGVPTGPRTFWWKPTAPATVVWVEALDGGDPKAKVEHRDRLLTLDAPFTGTPVELVRTEYRVQGGFQGAAVQWTDAGIALVTESDRPTRRMRTWRVDGPGQARLVNERSAEDAYANPGMPVRRPGRGTVLQHGTSIYLAGNGASPQGERPFLDRLDLDTLQKTRVFQSDEKSYEQVLVPIDDAATRLLTRRETRAEPPNVYVRQVADGRLTALTEYKDPSPQLSGVEKQVLTYARADGVKLSATLYLPPDRKPGERLPLLVWAYPREFVDPNAAGQVTGSPNRFIAIRGASHFLLLTQGYAILDDPSMPIVGEAETANDTYVEQLVASAKAAVDTVVEMGVADPDRLGVGGHSYGAFMTANLLAHSDLFRAGIARSGAYNRTLTPFGFQNESRTFWEAPEIYARMSPFWYASKVNEPILLLHGEADNNSGTFPIQSERFYMALKGHGATVRYVTLPHESHGYAARESVLHTVAEMVAWMDKWVKHA